MDYTPWIGIVVAARRGIVWRHQAGKMPMIMGVCPTQIAIEA